MSLALTRIQHHHFSIEDGCCHAYLLTAATVTTVTSTTTPAHAAITKDSIWPIWTELPVAPFSRRKTPGVYVFDQLIGIYYVHVPIRMTVCALERGLFVYAPVAPTRECLALLQPLMDEYGPIQYIVLPSVAVEHKVKAGPFARVFPDADFYVVDKQYAFPVNLPDITLGLPSWTKSLCQKAVMVKCGMPHKQTLGLFRYWHFVPTSTVGVDGCPFRWKSLEDELKSFQTYSNDGKATIFPIVQIIMARGNSGQATLDWVDQVSQWDFDKVVPAHLDAPLAMGPAEFRSNFDFIRKGVNEVRFCDEDVAFLRSAEEGFLNFSVFKSNLGPLRGRTVCGLD